MAVGPQAQIEEFAYYLIVPRAKSAGRTSRHFARGYCRRLQTNSAHKCRRGLAELVSYSVGHNLDLGGTCTFLCLGLISTRLILEIVPSNRDGDNISVFLCHSAKHVVDLYEVSLVVEVVLFNPTHALGPYVSKIE